MLGGNIKISWKDWLFILVGSGCMAVAVRLVYEPSCLVTGGFSGIGILLKPFGIPVGLATFSLNIPVFIWALQKKGFSFVKRSFLAMMSLSGWLLLLPAIQVAEEDLFLAALLGGGLTGVGLALVLMRGASTGGTDMLAVLLHEYFPNYSTIRIMQILDGAIVLAGAIHFGIPRALYALFAVAVFSRISDGILEGAKVSKAAWIITGKKEEVTGLLLHELKRGVTVLGGKGAYTGREMGVLICVVGKREILTLRKRVHQIDEKAFILVEDVREVYGEGFLSG